MTTEQSAPTDPTTPTDPIDPQRRAAAAAEALAAEGRPVTNRAVRERAGVAMAVAAEAASEWNERAAEQAQVPEAPDTLLARFAGIWREAYVVARDQLAAERDALTLRLHASENEVQSLTEDLSESDARVAELEAALGQARAEIEHVTRDAEQAADAAVAEHAAALSGERSRADRAEGALEAVTAERDRLLAQLETTRSTTSG